MSLMKTHLGSMPYKDVNKALKWAESFDLFTLPELPKLDSSQLMINRAINAINSNEPLLLFSNLLNKVEKDEIKLHCVGPATLSLMDEKYFKPCFDLILRAKGELDKRFDKVWLCLDEPSLNYVADYEIKKQSYNSLLKGVRDVGIHCCDKVSFSKIPNEVLSFISVSHFEISEFSEFRSWANDQNKLMLGVVKTDESYKTAKFSFDPEEMNFVYTPTCGLATIDENLADNIFQYLFDLS